MAAIIYFEKQSDGKRIKIITHDEAVKLQYAFTHPDKVTDDVQREKLAKIQAIHLGSKTTPPEQKAQLNTLEDRGVLQGKSEILPRGDR